MRSVMVRYRLKKERVEENEAFVRAVFAELERVKPPGLRYGSFKMSDGVTCVHFAETEAANPLGALESFKAFTAALADRCDEPPVVHELAPLGRYAG